MPFYKTVMVDGLEVLVAEGAASFAPLGAGEAEHEYAPAFVWMGRAFVPHLWRWSGTKAHPVPLLKAQIASARRQLEDHPRIKAILVNPRDLWGFNARDGVGLTERLAYDETSVGGELVSKEWRRITLTNGVPSPGPRVMRELYAYTRTPGGSALSKATTQTLYLESDSDTPTGPTRNKPPKSYTTDALKPSRLQIEEGIRRRGRLIRSLSAQVSGLILLALSSSEAVAIVEGGEFLERHGAQLDVFVKTARSAALIAAITADVDAGDVLWLDVDPLAVGATVRELIVAQLQAAS